MYSTCKVDMKHVMTTRSARSEDCAQSYSWPDRKTVLYIHTLRAWLGPKTVRSMNTLGGIQRLCCMYTLWAWPGPVTVFYTYAQGLARSKDCTQYEHSWPDPKTVFYTYTQGLTRSNYCVLYIHSGFGPVQLLCSIYTLRAWPGPKTVLSITLGPIQRLLCIYTHSLVCVLYLNSQLGPIQIPSLISLNGFCGRKAPCFLSDPKT